MNLVASRSWAQFSLEGMISGITVMQTMYYNIIIINDVFLCNKQKLKRQFGTFISETGE